MYHKISRVVFQRIEQNLKTRRNVEMTRGIIQKMMIFSSCLVLFFALSACDSVYLGFHKNSPPPPRAKKVVKKAPPDHAKAYGRRAKYTYRYYPDVQVYFDIHRKVYFYYEGKGWKASVTLPKRIKLVGHVTIEMDTDRPYQDFKNHRTKYPPGQAKNKKKKHS